MLCPSPHLFSSGLLRLWLVVTRILVFVLLSLLFIFMYFNVFDLSHTTIYVGSLVIGGIIAGAVCWGIAAGVVINTTACISVYCLILLSFFFFFLFFQFVFSFVNLRSPYFSILFDIIRYDWMCCLAGVLEHNAVCWCELSCMFLLLYSPSYLFFPLFPL